MELKRVEMVGFKSFPEKLSITFDKGITAIIGPNGSGKSNISDAIRWVLGEQSAKSLRGTRMEDVIFAGTQRRKPLGYAQVTLVLDNSDHKIDLPFEEIAICRRVYRSGESEYFVNQTRYRLKDIHEMLMDTGIGKDGYSVIGQGRIDQLLSTKPQERRLIFEEAAGIVKYKTRKEEAAKQLAEEAVSLSRVNDRLFDMEQRLGPLKEQAEKAEQYKALDEELRVYEINSFLDQYHQYKKQYDENESKLNALESDLEQARTVQEEAKARSAKLQEETESVGQAVTKAFQDLSTARLERESADGDRRLKVQEKEHAEQEITSSTARLNEVKAKLKARSQTIDQEEKLLKDLEKEDLAKEKLQNTYIEQDRSQAEALLLCGQARISAEDKWGKVRDQLEEQKRKRDALQIRVEQSRSVLSGADEQMSDLVQNYSEEKENLDRRTALREDLLAKSEAKNKEAQEKEARLIEMRASIHDTQRKAEAILQEIRSAQERLKWIADLEREYEGYSASVKTVMQLKNRQPQRWRGVRGTVADLITIPEPLTEALNVALGGAVQNIILEKQDEAKELIRILREQKAGRATFQPLDSVSGRDHGRSQGQILEMMQKQKKILGFADELITYDAQYKPVISRLLGNVIVVEDFDTGAALNQRFNAYYRIVTLKGEIFNIGGSITGGSSTVRENSILGRRADKERTQSSLKQKQQENQELTAKAAEQIRSRDRLQMELSSLKEELSSLESARMETEQEIAKSRFVVEQLEERRSRFDQTQQEQLKEIEERQAEMDLLEKQIENTSHEMEALGQQVESLRHEQEMRRRQNEELRMQMMQLQVERSAITQQRSSLDRTLEWEYNEIEDLSQEADALLDSTANDRERIASLEKEIESLGQRYEQLGQTILKLEKVSAGLEAKKTDKEREREQVIAETEEAIRICSGLEKEQIRLEAAFNRAKKDLTNLQDQIWEKYELTYNAALRLEKKDLGSKTAVAKRIQELRGQIRRLGPVSLQAIEEYAILSERFAIDTAQKEDIVKATESLEQVIRQLTRQMENQFEESFKQIAESFDKVFRRLFGGGRGILRLSEDAGVLDCGIEIIAQPPGKKLQNMMLLSGGERALTAIALLFSIQQLSPAPFCVLDEIEAALDDANVSRFAGYLNELCEHTQFIVITHRKGTMEAAHTMYGVTMEEKGISKCFSMQFEDTEEMEWIEDGMV